MERPDYTLTAEGNLFAPLSPECVTELGSAQGGELKRRSNGAPPKFHALHSSAALVANVFDYWRGRDLSVLSRALASPRPITRLNLEVPFCTGFGFPANLDVVLRGEDEKWLMAIESKFLEPFGSHEPGLRIGYLPASGDSAWKKLGLTKCDLLARDLQSRPDRFQYLNAPQNLKHILALSKAAVDQFRLLYLFYDVEGPAGDAHRAEAKEFKNAVDGEVNFEWMTYQLLVQRLRERSGDSAHNGYFDYLRVRYQL